MSTTTTNYELIKPELTDVADITQYNENWDIIDEKLKEQDGHTHTAEDVGALPISGGTLKGTRLWNGAGYGRWYSASNAVGFSHVQTANDESKNMRGITIYPSTSRTLDKSLVYADKNSEGVDTFYNLYGEHNKPTANDVGAVPATTIPTDPDLNKLVKDGHYFVAGTIDKTSNTYHLPTEYYDRQVALMTSNGTSGYFEFQLITWAMGSRCCQLGITPYTGDSESFGRMWYRVGYGQPSVTSWGSWKEVFTTAGGTLTGDLLIEKSYPRVKLKKPSTGRGVNLQATDSYVEFSNEVDGTNFRGIRIKPETEAVADSVFIYQMLNGAFKKYNLYGEHNKPSGSYTGNGSATQRTIAINAIYGTTALLQVNTQNTIGFFGMFGGFMYQTSDTTSPSITYFSNAEASYNGTNFVMSTTNKLLNNSGWVYQYKAL